LSFTSDNALGGTSRGSRTVSLCRSGVKWAANYNNTADEPLRDTWGIREHSWHVNWDLRDLKIRETAISTGHRGSIVQLQVHESDKSWTSYLDQEKQSDFEGLEPPPQTWFRAFVAVLSLHRVKLPCPHGSTTSPVLCKVSATATWCLYVSKPFTIAYSKLWILRFSDVLGPHRFTIATPSSASSSRGALPGRCNWIDSHLTSGVSRLEMSCTQALQETLYTKYPVPTRICFLFVL
jgi:hypothetical protein